MVRRQRLPEEVVMQRLRARLSYANVMATIAVFVALGGTSYAVTSLPRNSVGAAQIRSRAVGASEIRPGSVRSKQVRDRSLSVRDLSPAARESLRGQRGGIGPQGPAGVADYVSAAVDSSGRIAFGRGVTVP